MSVSSERGPLAGGSLVIQLARLGDFLQTTPLLAGLAAGGAPVGVLVTPGQEPLARHCPGLARVAVLDLGRLRREIGDPAWGAAARLASLERATAHLWNLGPATVYNLNLNPESALLAAGFQAPGERGWRLGPSRDRLVGEPWTPFMMALVADRRYTRLHLTDILASYGPGAPRPADSLAYVVEAPELAAADALLPAGRPLVALQLGTNSDLRRWPLDGFAALARGLVELGAGLVLVGVAGERPLGRRLTQALAPGTPVTNLMGATDIPTLAAVLARADLVVAGDTGTLHLATAVGARTLALFMGPAQVHETGPYGQGHLVLQARDHCGPCQENQPVCGGLAPCRRLLTPEVALAAARGLLGGHAAPEVAAGLALPESVMAHAGELDRFGQRYRPLVPRPLTVTESLGLALREAGRAALRPGLAPDWGALADQLAGEYQAPGPEDRRRLATLARGWRHGGAAEVEPALRPLDVLGRAAPALAPAAREAARQVLDLCAQKGGGHE